jgi:glutathione S-transferase
MNHMPAMKLKLYTAARSRGFCCEWLLEESGFEFDVVRLDLFAGEARSEEHRKIHPLGAVPALLLDGQAIFESVAICIALADRVPDHRLAPPIDDRERGLWLQWMVYAVATMEPKIAAPYIRSLSLPRAEWQAIATPEESAAFGVVLEPLRQGILRGSVLECGFSGADVLVGSELYWASQVGLLEAHGWSRAYLDSLMDRPEFKRAELKDRL